MNIYNEFIVKKFNVNLDKELPIELPIDRLGMIKLFRKFGYLKGAEIGVSKGRFSKEICKIMPKAKLYGIDAWLAYDGYVERKGMRAQGALNRHYEEAKERLKPFNCELIKGLSMDVVKQFEDESLDFIFIDGNHSYKYAYEDIKEWSKKVKKGGIISGHDFWNSRDGFGHLRLPITDFIRHLTPEEEESVCQVKDVVLDWTKENNIFPWYVTGADDLSSWFWVKE